MEFLERGAHLLAHLRTQVLHGLDAVDRTLALVGRHPVELAQAVEQPLLRAPGAAG